MSKRVRFRRDCHACATEIVAMCLKERSWPTSRAAETCPASRSSTRMGISVDRCAGKKVSVRVEGDDEPAVRLRARGGVVDHAQARGERAGDDGRAIDAEGHGSRRVAALRGQSLLSDCDNSFFIQKPRSRSAA